jgi:DNA-binding Lrp family transcriptional regulator
MQVDLTDRKIIRILRQNGRETALDIATQVGINRVTVARRLQRLIADRVIYITAFSDPRRIHFNRSVYAAFNVSPNQRDVAVHYLRRQNGTGAVFLTRGCFNVMSVMGLDSQAALADCVINTLNHVPGSLDKTVLQTVHPADPAAAGIEPPESLSRQGQRMLELLYRDGRQSTVSLARGLGVSVPTAQRELTRYLESGLFRVTTQVNPAKADWLQVAILCLRAKPGDLGRVMAWLRAQPGVQAANYTIGEFEILARLETPSTQELNAFAGKVEKRAGIIRCEMLQVQDLWFGQSGDTPEE